MTPRSSAIGYLVYDELILPITSIVLRDGNVVFQSLVHTDPEESISIDTNAGFKVMGVDGSHLLRADRYSPEPEILSAAAGGYLSVEQVVVYTSSERMQA